MCKREVFNCKREVQDIYGSAVYVCLPCAKEQCHAFVAELLIITLHGTGGVVGQGRVCGAPLMWHYPEGPGQQGLKLCMGNQGKGQL